MNGLNRRNFLRRSAAVLGLTLIDGLEALADEEIPNFEGFEKLIQHDGRIKRWVDYWNTKFENVGGYKKIEYGLVKRMALVESGGDPNNAWLINPLQIGNGSDPGLGVLQREEENTKLIGDFSDLKDIKPAKRENGRWDYSNTGIDADLSFFGGLGWLLHKAAIYGFKQVEEGEILEYEIKEGDTYGGIASSLGTIVKNLLEHNETDPKKLQIGQIIKYKKTKNVCCITGWRDWKTALVRYNGGGDSNYLKKIDGLTEIK